MGARKIHNHEDGYVAERTNPYVAGTKVVIYRAEEADIDVAPDKYAVVCDAHGTLVGDTSIPKARLSMKDPSNFCEECAKIAGN